MANFEENVEEMVGTTREAAAVSTESDGDETVTRLRTRPGTRPAVSGTRPATRRRQWLLMNEMAATGRVIYTDEGS